MQSDFARRLLHRWFVQYNPLYLVSATLVLGGMILSSRGLANDASASPYGPLGVAAIAELYAATLIGGAALLTRIGQRRPAVMLALITVLYQGDLTLHTEACVYLGGAGVAASVLWLALFVGKLLALAWAMKVELSKHALATVGAGAAGVALMPYAMSHFDEVTNSAFIAIGVYALAGFGTSNGVTSRVPLDEWGETVRRRTVRASYSLFGLMLAGHCLFWSSEHRLHVAPLLPIAVILATRLVPGEARRWPLLIAALLGTLLFAPAFLSVVALLTAVELARHAMTKVPDPATLPLTQPYRGSVLDPTELPLLPLVPLVRLSESARVRAWMGAVLSLHLAAWTFGWKGDVFPAHVLALDLAAGLALVVVAWRHRSRFAVTPVGLGLAHAAFRSGLVPMPASVVQWGGLAVGLGFAVLIGSIAMSYRLRDRPES